MIDLWDYWIIQGAFGVALRCILSIHLRWRVGLIELDKMIPLYLHTVCKGWLKERENS